MYPRDVFVSYFYDEGFRDWILEAKSEKPEWWQLLARADFLNAPWEKVDAILPVASDPVLDRKRGFSPSRELAERLATLFGVPLVSNPILRSPFLKAQKEMSRLERLKWLRRTLTVSRSGAFDFRSILLVDDVWVTGATIEAHRQLLTSLNPDLRVQIFCLAGVAPNG